MKPIKIPFPFLILIFSSLILLPLTADNNGSDGDIAPAEKEQLQNAMTAEEFKDAGLDKLSPEELAYLNQWLGRYVEEKEEIAAQVAVEEAIPQGEDAFGLETVTSKVKELLTRDSTPEVITSRIVGKFKGWKGKTRVKLENGQIWEQRTGGSIYHVKENPEVEIKRGVVGYRMRVEGIRKWVGVKRIK